MTQGQADEQRSLVSAAVRGDVEAVREVWQRHRRWVAAILLAHKPARVELEDLLQDVAMTFVRTIGRLRDEGSLKPWLRTVAINAARAAARGPALRLSGLPEVEPDGGGTPDRAGAHEEATRLMDLARALPEGYREPLMLRCVQGMSHRQIGELMGLPETTVETRIARGRRMLRELAVPEGAKSASPMDL